MAFPFNQVVQHHEGAGKPRNGAKLPHYSYIIGLTEWHLRDGLITPAASPSPAGDTSVLDFNRKIIGVCLTGQRQTGIPDSPAFPITDDDIVMMQEIGVDARRRGWLVDHPIVTPHNKMPNNGGACPGNLTIVRWPEINNAYQLSTPGNGDMPADGEFVASCSSKDGSWKMKYDGSVFTISGAFYGSYFTLSDSVRNDPSRRFLTMFANQDRGYSIVSTKGEVYKFNIPA